MKNLNNVNDWLEITQHQKIGEILMQSGNVNLKNLGMALDIQKFDSIPLGEILINMKIIKAEDLKKALVIQQQIDENNGNRGL